MNIRLRHLAGMPVVVAAVAGGLSLVASPATTTEAAAPASADLPEYHLVAGETIARESWVLPVESYELTGRFGAVSGLWSTVHTGLDFATVVGAPIRSVANGVVVSVGYDGAYGNKTVIRLGDGTEVWYCHQTSASVAPGQRVERGQVIGTVGVTGNTTGPHLHLEIRPGGGDPVDPELSLRRHRVEP